MATFDRAVRGDHEDGGFVIARADFLEHLHAAFVGHHQIQQHQIVEAGFKTLEAFGGVGGQTHLIAFLGKQSLQAFADVGFVVDHQNAAAGGFRGNNVRREIRERQRAGAAPLQTGNRRRSGRDRFRGAAKVPGRRPGHYWIILSDRAI